MMFGLIALTFITAMPAIPQVDRKVGKTHTLHVPNEIEVAMQPYVDCKLQAIGATMRDKDGKPKPVLVNKGGDCSKYRLNAEADADVVLRGLGKSDADREKIVAKTLKRIDDFVEEMRQAMADAERGA